MSFPTCVCSARFSARKASRSAASVTSKARRAESDASNDACDAAGSARGAAEDDAAADDDEDDAAADAPLLRAASMLATAASSSAHLAVSSASFFSAPSERERQGTTEQSNDRVLSERRSGSMRGDSGLLRDRSAAQVQSIHRTSLLRPVHSVRNSPARAANPSISIRERAGGRRVRRGRMATRSSDAKFCALLIFLSKASALIMCLLSINGRINCDHSVIISQPRDKQLFHRARTATSLFGRRFFSISAHVERRPFSKLASVPIASLSRLSERADVAWLARW